MDTLNTNLFEAQQRLLQYPALPCHTSSDCPEFCHCQGNLERTSFDSTNPDDYSLLGSCLCEGNTGWNYTLDRFARHLRRRQPKDEV